MRIVLRAAAFAALLALVGCGSSEEPLYDVSGAVTYSGGNIPRGMVYFDPDSSKGTLGLMGYAEIIDGKFDTKVAGQGVRVGAYRLRISGYDGKPAEEAPYGKALFPEYTTTKVFAAESNKLTIDIPKAGR